MPPSETPPAPSPALAAAREAFYGELPPFGLKPLWNVLRATLTPEPVRREIPYLWRWEDVRPRLLRAGELVTAHEAERRVLMFINPGNPQEIGSTATLYAAMQIILPGEVAPAHRHSPSALRFVVEGRGGYTNVEGSRIDMEPGDLVLTPSGVWHDHGNLGDGPVMWMDGLDIPVLLAMNAMFFESHPAGRQVESQPRRGRELMHGRALFPVGPRVTAGHSPIWCYRWTDVRTALDTLASTTSPDAHDGHAIRYVNPATGGDVLSSIGCRAHRLPAGRRTLPQRTFESFVIHVVEGRGESLIEGKRIEWQKGDTFAIPIWSWFEHQAHTTDAYLFAMNDAPLIGALGLGRVERREG